MHAAQFKALNIAVLTVSDTRDESTDTSGRYLAEALVTSGHKLQMKEICKDDRFLIRAHLSRWLIDDTVDVILTNGGTGVTGRDITVEAVSPLMDKQVEGFGELFRWLSYEDIGTSTVQSRCFAGLANGKYVFCLPGSNGAVRLAWEKILAPQLDARTKPCNFANLIHRLKE